MKFVWLVEDDITRMKKILFLTGLDPDTSLVYIGKFPEIMSLAMKNKIPYVFKIMYGNNGINNNFSF